MNVVHPPAAIIERIVVGRGNLRLDYWERFTFLIWLYLAYNPDATAAQLEPTIKKQLAANRFLAAGEEVFATSQKALEWLEQPNPDLEGSRPIELLANPPGERQVRSLLERMEQRLSPEERKDVLELEVVSPDFVAKLRVLIEVYGFFGEQTAMVRWMNESLGQFGGRQPAQMLETAEGRDAILEQIAKMNGDICA